MSNTHEEIDNEDGLLGQMVSPNDVNLKEVVSHLMSNLDQDDLQSLMEQAKQAKEFPDEFVLYLLITINYHRETLDTLAETLKDMGVIEIEKKRSEDERAN